MVNCQQAQFTHDHNIHGSRYIYIYIEGGGDVRMQTYANEDKVCASRNRDQ